MTRVAQWAFAAFYGIVALIAIWGGIVQLNPPPPPASPFNPNPLPPLVNPAMATAAMFYFLTAAVFAAVTFNAVQGILSKRAGGLVQALNVAFAAFLAIVALYLVWYGGVLAVLGGSFFYLLTGLALGASAVLLYLRNPLGALIYAGIVAVWIVISIMEAGLDFLALLPRLAAFAVVGLWFLSPWHRRAMGKTPEVKLDAGGRWVGGAVAASALLLALAAMQGYSVNPGTDNKVAGIGVADWRNYGGTPGGQRFAQIDQINLENVGKLEKAWEFRTGVPYDFKQTPQMANGLIYICTAGSTLIAVDSDTGEERWRHDTRTNVPGGLNNASTFARTCRGLGYHEAPAEYVGECARRIIAGTTDARLVAVDALTGRRCETFGFGGEVNLVSGLGYAPLGNFMVTSTPLIAGDKVVVGGWVTDNQQIGNPSGVLRAYDTLTGQFAWAWDMGNPGYHGLPDEGGEYTRGTPNVWSNTAYDPVLNLVYAPTGNSSPDYFDGDLRSKESEENASSIVAIDAATGERRWVYQTVHRDIWDWDVPSQPVLVDIRKNGEGELIPAVAQATKRGEIFLLDRRTGVPIYETPELPVPQNPEQGEVVTATQPFSPLPHFRDDRVEKDMWGLTPLDMIHCRIEFKKMRYDGHFTPPMRGGGGYGQHQDTWGGTFQYPGNAGGFNWGSVAVDADNGILVGAPMLMGNRIVLRSLEDRAEDQRRNAERRAAAAARRGESEGQAAAPAPRGGPGGPGGGAGPGGGGGGGRSAEAAAHAQRFDQSRVLYRGDTTPFMSDWRLPLPWLQDADNQLLGTNLPCFEPPFGQIGAIDLNTNKLLWKRPIGSMKLSGPFGISSGLPYMVGTPLQGGTMATRGGLAFHGGSMDATFRAFDIRTGDVKWQYDLPGSAHATPMSYVGKNGKQYVLITVPTPSWRYPRPSPAELGPPSPQGGYVIAFALPDAPAAEELPPK
jgi:membrane-bound PQQ-dependent dehydrogenase (glucose/quinate/shikimate family)